MPSPTAALAPTEDVAAFLVDALGAGLVAFITGVDEGVVKEWASGTSLPEDLEEQKLRKTERIFRLLVTAESSPTARAWIAGLNPQLDDRSPATAIRDGHDYEALAAAQSYIAAG
jgi:hypothetical protein